MEKINDQPAPATETEAILANLPKPFAETVASGLLLHTPRPTEHGTAWETKFIDAPYRKTGDFEFSTLESFLDFIAAEEEFAFAEKPSSTRIYATVGGKEGQNFTVEAVLNDHGKQPGFRDFSASYAPELDRRFARWFDRNRAQMSQEEIAGFLESNISDIVSDEVKKTPSGAEVLAFVSRLTETRSVKYGRAINLQNGMTELEYVETGDSATKGRLEVFREFAIGIPVFKGGPAYRIRAFLRYRINKSTGDIAFWFELQQEGETIDDAIAEIIGKVRAATSLPVFMCAG